MAKGKHRIRIIAGELKGRLLDYPDSRAFRPTMQRTRSSLFESLGVALEGAVVMDLFAAAGGLGIEALSRGARFALFVEKHRDALDCLRHNLTQCNLSQDRYRVHAGDVFEFLERGLPTGVKPDIVLADPPYDVVNLPLLLELLGGIVYPASAVVVIEHRADAELVSPGGFSLSRRRMLGQTVLSTFGKDV